MFALFTEGTEGPFIQHSELPIPPLMFGLIAMSIFVLLAFITFSYRDVANRRADKDSNSQGH